MSAAPRTIGFNHVATMTADIDRYLAFYTDIFGDQVLSVTEAHEEHPKMAIVNIGGSELNVFEVPAEETLLDIRDPDGAELEVVYRRETAG